MADAANCEQCGAGVPPGADRCPECEAPTTGAGPEVRQGESKYEPPWPAPKTSVLRGGPTSFGLAGKLFWTAVVVLVGVALAGVAFLLGLHTGRPGLALVWVLFGIYVVLAVMGLWGLWRPTRVE